MKTDNDNETAILNGLTSIIYEWLFGMTRKEMLAECKNHTPDGWRNLWNDEDENMCDHLSIAALNCLSSAELAITSYIKDAGLCLTESCLAEMYMIIEPYRVEGIIVWNDES